MNSLSSESSGSSQYGIFGNRCCVSNKRNIIVAAPGCTDDISAVATLPDDWVPRHSGPILENYLKERKQNHENLLNNMYKEAALINETVNTDIRKLAQNLLAYIKQNDLDMGCAVDNINADPQCPELRAKTLNTISDIYAQRIDAISTFKQEAYAIENQRAEKIRKLLQQHFQHIVKNGHSTPRDLLHEFDQRVYEVNQQLLSNNRAYLELEAELRAQADECVVRVKSNFNQVCLGIPIEEHRRSTFSWQRDDRASIESDIPYEKKRGASDVSLGNNIINDVEEFDDCVSLLVQAYRNAVMNAFSGFSGKLCDLRTHLGCVSYLELYTRLEETADTRDMVEKILQRLNVNLQKCRLNCPALAEKTHCDTLQMQKRLSSLGEQLRETYTILHDSGHLWDAHMGRSALAQQMTVTCVEDISTNNDAIELANEINFNIALEQLRSAPDPEKLQQHYESIIFMLDRTEDMYKQHNETEMTKLEDFLNFLEPLSDTLMSELNCFLEKFPRPSTQITDPTTTIPAHSPRLEVHTLSLPLPRAMLQTELQEVYLSNWRNGFLESFENNLVSISNELRQQARIWVDERARALHMRHMLKLISHSIRKERVKAARDSRLAELKYHDSRLESHLEAVYDLVDKLPAGAAEFLSLDAPELYPFCKWVDNIQTNIDALMEQEKLDYEVKQLKMCSYAPRLRNHRTQFEESLNEAIELGKRQVENRIQEARISNVRFMSQLKLLGEDGRYSAQEALKACTLLMKVADSIEACLTKTIDILNKRRLQIIMLADQKLSPIQKIVDEFTKNEKSGEKRKSAGKKK